MPTVSTPSVGSGFYVPGSSGFYTGAVPSSSAQTSSAAETTSSQIASAQDSSAAQSASSVNEDNTALLNALTSSSSGLSSLLSAGDLNSLASLGSLGNLSGLLGDNASLLSSVNSGSTGNGRYLTSTSTNDAKLLQQILTELESLKKEVSQQQNLEKASYGRNLSQGPRILRFLADGKDVLSTCREVFFSSRESDGTFLLTGDRTYTAGTSDATNYNETFYLLFKATGCTAGRTNYTVTPSLSQAKSDPSSSLADFSQAGTFTASRTGNLVAMRGKAGNTTIDLLLSLDN